MHPLIIDNLGTVNNLVVKVVKGSYQNMFLLLTQTFSLWNTKEPTFISTEKALMELEAHLSRGLFLQQFVQMGLFTVCRIPL